MPNTRPGITFENGVCVACTNFKKQSSVDWASRKKELEKLCDKYRGCNGSGYDCAIAVSGGKDSHFQVYYFKEVLKMNPVLLTVGSLEWTKTGRSNIENLSETFGCDIIEFQPNRKVAREMTSKSFEEIGATNWYVDALIYTFPVKMAMQLGLKFLVFGEDVGYTYGGTQSVETPSAIKQHENDVVKPIWKDWFKEGELTEEELDSTKHPTIEECTKFGLESIYLSYYIPWNSVHNFDVARKYGFHHLGHEYQRENTIENYDHIDSLFAMVHPFLKYIKLGHSSATDNASRWIRYGLATREEMIPFVKKHDGKLDQGAVDKFCEFTKMSYKEFWQVLDKWYNTELFEKDDDGIWHPKFEVGKGLIN